MLRGYKRNEKKAIHRSIWDIDVMNKYHGLEEERLGEMLVFLGFSLPFVFFF
jgi:hypothetical protein